MSKQKPIIKELLNEYFPKKYYPEAIREKAEKMALEFMETLRKEYAMQDALNLSIFLGRELTKAEKIATLKAGDFNYE